MAPLAPVRSKPTTADYVLTALAPALIMGMIGCLIFFLITLLYRGDFTIRLMYILGLYTFASVLIARIAIEQTRAVSTGYALVLGVATLLVVNQYVQFPGGLQTLGLLVTAGFLALIILLADRITFDCTLIDEKIDSSGEGLLQSLGLLPSALAVDRKLKKKAELNHDSERMTRKHNPGVWVLYFALLALPLFGIGQLMIPEDEVETRSQAFWFLFVYLWCALTLLVSTSFLGMRRYLRQRSITMPADMTMTWLFYGCGSILMLLVLASFLPLPGRQFGLFGLPFTVNSSDKLLASRLGWGAESFKASEDDSRRITESDSDEAPGNETRADGQHPGGNVQNDGKTSSNSPGKPSGSARGAQGRSGNSGPGAGNASRSGKSPISAQPNQKQSTARSKNPSTTESPKFSMHLPSNLDGIIKLISIILLIGVIAGYLLFHWKEVAAGLRAFMVWWSNLWGRKSSQLKSESKGADAGTPAVHHPPFTAFVDPFGIQTKGWPLERIVRHSFAAVEAWGREQRLARADQETPEEYLRRLSQKFPEQESHFERLGALYNRLAYAQGKMDGSQVSGLAKLWNWLRRSTQQ